MVQCLKLPLQVTSPKIKKPAAKAAKSSSMLITEETRELGASVTAHLSPLKKVPSVPPKRISTKK
jgi:hypothetical protein